MLKECLIHKQNLTNHILQSSALYTNMYKNNPRMVPNDIVPECQKIFITVQPDSKPQKRRNVKIKDMFDNMPSKGFNSHLQDQISAVDATKDRIPEKRQFWNKENPLATEHNKEQIDFSKKIGKFRVLQQTSEIGHSRSSELLVSLLQFAESKKYDIPITQVPVMPSQLLLPPKPVAAVPVLKQTDIRNMFAKVASSNNIVLTPKDTEIHVVDEIDIDKLILSKLNIEIESYLTSHSEDTCCAICENLFDCSQIKSSIEFDVTTLLEPEPDISILNSCNSNNFEMFTNLLKSDASKLSSPKIRTDNNTEFIKPVTPNVNIYERTFMNPIDTTGLKNTPLRQPNSVQNVLKKCGITPNLNDSLFENVSFTQIEQQSKIHSEKCDKIPFLMTQAFTEAEFTQMKDETAVEQESLTFFNVSSLEDIFIEESSRNQSQLTIIYTPECINTNANVELSKSGSESPILCTYDKAHQLKNRVHKKLFDSFTENNCSTPIENESPTLDSEQPIVADSKKTKTYCENDISDDVSAFADLCVFGFDDRFELPPSNKVASPTPVLDIPEDPWFDFLFEIPKEGDVAVSKVTEQIDSARLENEREPQILNLDPDIISKQDKEVIRTERTDFTQKNEHRNIDFRISSDGSPILQQTFSQVNRVSSNSISDKIQCCETANTVTLNNHFKLSMKKPPENVTNINTDRPCNLENKSKHTVHSINLDESFQFTFNMKKTPTRPKRPAISSSSSGSPIISKKPVNNSKFLQGATTPKSALSSAVVISSDSEEDFQKPVSTTNWIKMNPRNILQSRQCDSTEKRLCDQNIVSSSRRKCKRKKQSNCEYLDVEAELQMDDDATSDSSETTDDDKFETSFVDDDTQNVANTTLTHAQYLKSVRSPVNRGMFIIPQKPRPNIDVYSQLVDQSENTYVNDTFCVDTDDEMEVLSQERTFSELEVAELVIEAEQTNSKSNRKKLNKPRTKRRRIMQILSDSD